MGSRSTKVATPPHVNAVASPVAPTQEHHKTRNDTNETRPCQESLHQATRATMTSVQFYDKIDLEQATQTTTTSRRRYSEPAQTAAMATELNSQGTRHLDAFESFVVERNLMAIDIEHGDSLSLLPTPQPSSGVANESISTTPEESEESEVQCISCCAQLPKEKDPMYAKKVIKPCRSCNSVYCIPCVKSMFINACRDSTRMPPRCCIQIHLHHIKPHLTTEEVTEYKSRYEEWSTPKPFYCPVPTCSVFIPERILPQRAGIKGKRRVDSGIGTPTSPDFQCPKCKGDICVDCRQPAHKDRLCALLDLGVDAETAALLKSWGYKRCPKCSQGLKRMYGCNHMECRCGAHFCWGCLRSRDECEGGCYEDDDEDDGSDDEPDEPESLPTQNDGTETIAVGESTSIEPGMAAADQDSNEAITATTITLETAARSRNLDGGSARYWENQDFDFGDEPTDDVQDRIWECHHSFEPYTISLTEAIAHHPSAHEMDCVKCWSTIRPDIETPQKPTSPISAKTTPTPPSRRQNTTIAGRDRGDYGTRGRGRAVVGRLRPVAYVPPRGLFRLDATIGTASHLTARLPTPGSWPAETRRDSMEDIRSRLYADLAESKSASHMGLTRGATAVSPTSNVFNNTPHMDSVAQECHNCSLLVCRKCADDILVEQQAEQDAQE